MALQMGTGLDLTSVQGRRGPGRLVEPEHDAVRVLVRAAGLAAWDAGASCGAGRLWQHAVAAALQCLRGLAGPALGRLWWSTDAIHLLVPALLERACTRRALFPGSGLVLGFSVFGSAALACR